MPYTRKILLRSSWTLALKSFDLRAFVCLFVTRQNLKGQVNIMALPGEVGHINTKCKFCGEFLPAQVLRSGAGWYIGTYCSNCGPYSRESGYYRTEADAESALEKGTFGR
jgi:hypothetical protein